MSVSFLIDVEASLPSLVSDAVLESWAKHHLTAAHEIVQTILKLRLECFLINQIEVD